MKISMLKSNFNFLFGIPGYIIVVYQSKIQISLVFFEHYLVIKFTYLLKNITEWIFCLNKRM